VGPPLPGRRAGIRQALDGINGVSAALSYPAFVAQVQEILQRVREIPEGYVRTYGDLAPGAPRAAGAALAAADDPTLPWHRVVRADGSLAKGDRQQARLRAEGVPFRGARVEMRVARLPV
jgi:alkylated DNA nucleotide flippase Atl1